MATILIVDDDVNLSRLLQMQLTNDGYDVALAFRGDDAMAQAMRDTPDLILLDVILPDVTGFQMCNQFRRADATKDVPIIMISAAARHPNQKQFAFERGANEYVLKPLHFVELGEMVGRYIGTKKAPSHTATPSTSSPLPAPEKNPSTATPNPNPLLGLHEFLRSSLPTPKPGH